MSYPPVFTLHLVNRSFSHRRFLVQEVSNEDFNTPIELEAKNWHQGIYIVRLHTTEGTVNKKLVVM